MARSDPTGFLATPVETVKRGRGDLARIVEILAEIAEDSEVPCSRSSSACRARSRAARGRPRSRCARGPTTLAEAVAPLPVRLADERLTTVTAEAMLRDRDDRGAERRAVVDQAAAVLILQHVLDTERTSGVAPGEIVERTA